MQQSQVTIVGEIDTVLDFDVIAQAVAVDVSATTNRVYQQTYRAWFDFCQGRGVPNLMLTPDTVRAFLIDKPTTKATRQRQLSAIRKLASKAHTVALIVAPQIAPRFEGIKKLLDDMKAPSPDRATQDALERDKKALSPAEADQLLRAWDGSKDRDKRNRALIYLLLLTGLRRSEAALLKWSDVDFENGVIRIRHGKGGKTREVAIAGDSALNALHAWKMAQVDERIYVFCAVKKNGMAKAQDKPITGTDVYRIVKATEARTGITFKPHDLRRTFITEGLHQGLALAEMQEQVGHARGETTMLYAQTTTARQRRKALRLRYG